MPANWILFGVQKLINTSQRNDSKAKMHLQCLSLWDKPTTSTTSKYLELPFFISLTELLDSYSRRNLLYLLIPVAARTKALRVWNRGFEPRRGMNVCSFWVLCIVR